jgi:hypothetical protein
MRVDYPPYKIVLVPAAARASMHDLGTAASR